MSEPREKALAAADLGTRYKCYKCGAKFYDLSRPRPLCPSCGADQHDDESKEVSRRKRRRRPNPHLKAAPTITAPEEGDEPVEVVPESDADYAPNADDIVIDEYAGEDKG